RSRLSHKCSAHAATHCMIQIMSTRICLAILAATVALAQQSHQMRAGAFAADITPQQWPVRLIGGFEQPLADKANDPLHARALVLDDGRTKIAIVVFDSCYLPRAFID